MFKNFFTLAVVVVLFASTGCVIGPPLPPTDLSSGNWAVKQGQAVWRRNAKAPELAGEILLAHRPDGSALVQFSKPPFPIIVAQRTPNAWQLEVPAQNRHFRGRGRPPARLLWLQLPDLLNGVAPPKGWSWKAANDGSWELANARSGEFLRGYFNP